MTRAIEAALGRHRAITLAALALLTILAWVWLLAGAGTGMAPLVSLAPFMTPEAPMSGMSMDGGMAPAPSWSVMRFALTFSMWWVMMVAMMLPSAAPAILLYARAVAYGRRGETRPPTESFLAGYLLAWGLFSLAATATQLLLEGSGLLDPIAMTLGSRRLSAVLLLLAGAYQLSPVKDMCLRHCRNPARFLSEHYRPGRVGALRMGVVHGFYCVGCCWLLMVLLFVGGVMNLVWIALLTVMVALEKLLPFGRAIALGAGVGCLALGGALLLAA